MLFPCLRADNRRGDRCHKALHLLEHQRVRLAALATLAPVANECYVGPYYPRKPGEEKFALAFVIPMNAPGLTILAREGFHHGQSAFDRPLTSRFDEGDAILMFDRVFVPDDRVIIEHPLNNETRFLAGIATAVGRANGRDKTERFQAAIGELIALVSIAEGIRAGALADTLRRVQAYAQGKLTIEGDGSSEPAAMVSPGNAAVNFFSLIPIRRRRTCCVWQPGPGSSR